MMNETNTDKVMLIKFGLTMTSCFAVITLVIFLGHKHSIFPTATISLFFLLLTLCLPILLKYFYIAWMKLAFVLGWFNTRLLLCIIFYLILLPFGLFMRLLKHDSLERGIEPKRNSYWKIKEKALANDYERQF